MTAPKLSISIACWNAAGTTRECLRSLLETTRVEEVELILVDNGSTDQTARVLASFPVPHKKIIRNGINLGFGAAHNAALEVATGEFFLCLNNDLFIDEPGWMDKCLRQFQDPTVALVGLEGTPSVLLDDGQGRVAAPGQAPDYVEGSFVMGKTSLFRRYGLFSPTFHLFICEDSDLSLRYRQGGYRILHVPVSHVHQHSVSLNRVNPIERRRISEHNHNILRARWGPYLRSRSFTQEVLVDIPSIGIGDVMCMIPVVKAVQKDHPFAAVYVCSRFPELFQHVHDHIITVQDRSELHTNNFDRVVVLNPNYGDYALLADSAARGAATTVASAAINLNFSEDEIISASRLLKEISGNRTPVFVSLVTERVSWHGRSVHPDFADRIVDSMRTWRGAERSVFIEVGTGTGSLQSVDVSLLNQTTVRELCALFHVASRDPFDCRSPWQYTGTHVAVEPDSPSPLFLGVDSFPFHAAQAARLLSIVLFGATEPMSRVTFPEGTRIVRRAGLPCLGCYQAKGEPGFNVCHRGDEACMQICPSDVYLSEDPLKYWKNSLRRAL